MCQQHSVTLNIKPQLVFWTLNHNLRLTSSCTSKFYLLQQVQQAVPKHMISEQIKKKINSLEDDTDYFAPFLFPYTLNRTPPYCSNFIQVIPFSYKILNLPHQYFSVEKFPLNNLQESLAFLPKFYIGKMKGEMAQKKANVLETRHSDRFLEAYGKYTVKDQSFTT